ncbi:hypothetical protein MMC30_001405 [Trapelia coarctata]|nr:hypothetical protein [Trapelia coarctata]
MEPVFDIIKLMRQEAQPGFTPVRRRDQPPQNASPELSTSAPWTTSRCNRLLRPLSSRITLLRRHREHKRLQIRHCEAAAPGNDLKPRRRTEDNTCDVPQIFPRQPSKHDDPEWTPDYEPRKKLKRTYSARGGSQRGTQVEVRQGQPIPMRRAQFRIQVPLVDPQSSESCRLSVQEQISQVGTRYMRGISVPAQADGLEEVTRPRAQTKLTLTRESFRRIAKSVSPDEWMLECGIYNGLYALLKATAKHSPQPVAGARSLFATCLRKVPEYIAEEQRWVDEEDEDEDKDISSIIYGELESLGSGESAGWKPLREIVRAHGIAIIGDAIKDGTIRPGTARGLTILCLEHGEADALLDCSLSTLRPLAKPVRPTDDLFETSICMRALRDMAGQDDQWRFLHKSLNQLLLRGIVPVEWMSCRSMISCWNQASRSITMQNESATEAANLIRTVTSLSYQTATTLCSSPVHLHRLLSRGGGIVRRKSMYSQTLGGGCTGSSTDFVPHEEAKMNAEFTGTLSRLLAILLSISTMYSEEEGTLAAGRHRFMQELLLSLAVDAHQLESTAPCSAQATRICLPLLAYVFSSAQRGVDDVHKQLCITFLSSIGRVESKPTEIGTLASFLCAIAHCCEKNGGKTGFGYMEGIVQKLLQLSQHSACNRLALRSINTLIMEAAFDFAEQTSRQEHLDWALEVEETIEMESAAANGQQKPITPARATQKKGSGFRWEDGICEWVAKTPAPFAVLIPKPEQCSSESASSSEEDDKTDVSTLPSELEDSSVLSQPTRRPRGRPPGTKRAQSSASRLNEPAVKPITRSRQFIVDSTRGDANELNTQKRSRGRPPNRRPCLADVTNCTNASKENRECVGDFKKARRLRGCAVQDEERRTSGRKRKGVGWAAGDVSEDELGM